MHRLAVAIRLALGFGVAVVACSTPAPAPREAGESSTFPSPAQLDTLGGAPPPAKIFDAGVRDVERWSLEGPFPSRVASDPFTWPTPWGRLLAEQAEQRAGLVVPTEAMHCVARQLGRFYLAHRARPADSLRRFMVARCHASAASVGFAYLHTEAPESVSDAELFERWRAQASDSIRRQLLGGPRAAGVWFGRGHGQAVFVAAHAAREVRLEPLETSLRGGSSFALEGEVLTPTGEVQALVTRGRYGYAACERAPDVLLPRFRFRCEVDAGDDAVALNLSLAPPGRFLSHAALDLLVWPRGAPRDEFVRPSYEDPRLVSDAGTAARRLVEMLNRVRERAGLRSLEPAPEQSSDAALLAPHFFASLFGRGGDSLADMVALGMIAGWNVDGTVQSGRFTASWVAESNDLDQLLSSALEYPVGREVLLDPDSDRIAVGALLDGDRERPSLAAVFATYALFSEEAHDANVQRVFGRLRSLRQARGLPPPQPLRELSQLALRAASQVQGGAEPRDALDALLEESAEALGRPVSGWISQVGELSELEFPDDFLARPTLGVAVGVSHHQPRGEPWGRYVVMLVAASPESRRL